AADYQPKVVYSDESAQSATETNSAAAAPVEEADPNYPATNYQPKVLFSDADYKHSSAAPSAPGAASSASSSSAASVSASSAEDVQVEKPASSDLSLFGIIALAAAGFYFFSKKQSGASGAAAAASEDYTASVGGSTGVEKYLEKMGANKTGVAKYLEKQTENPKTGVAKYMAKQIVKDREAAAARATGVEKYLRDKA
ncbi:MAG: hypothetical protein PHH11_16720, partial [Methylomonas sp.]|nr:hypothetical protein [Methylomonas sp.]